MIYGHPLIDLYADELALSGELTPEHLDLAIVTYNRSSGKHGCSTRNIPTISIGTTIDVVSLFKHNKSYSKQCNNLIRLITSATGRQIDWLITTSDPENVLTMPLNPDIHDYHQPEGRLQKDIIGDWAGGGVPKNVLVGTKATNQNDINWLQSKLSRAYGCRLFAMCDPLNTATGCDLDLSVFGKFRATIQERRPQWVDMVVIGGPSSNNGELSCLNDIERLVHTCMSLNICPFVTSIGNKPVVMDEKENPFETRSITNVWKTNDPTGYNMDHWPELIKRRLYFSRTSNRMDDIYGQESNN